MALAWIDLVSVATLVGVAAYLFLRYALRAFRPPHCLARQPQLIQIQDRRPPADH
jgi:hypothetical protein